MSILLLYGMLTINHAIATIAENKILLEIIDGAKAIRNSYLHLVEHKTLDTYLAIAAKAFTKGISIVITR